MYRLLFLNPYKSSIIYISPKSNYSFINPYNIYVVIYNLGIRDHSSTSSYQHVPPWFTFNKRYAYRILSIAHSLIYSSNCPFYITASLVQRSSFPSLRKYASHLPSTPIIRPSKLNTRELTYIGPKLWNSLLHYIRSIKSHKTFMKYIQQFISSCNL